jgi:serine phosphatase RsbU (regulator of sigma subunit)
MSVKKKLFSYRPGIRMIISAACVFGILGGSGFSVYYAMKSLYDTSLQDASTILFLDLETRSNSISEELANFIQVSKKKGAISDYKIVDNKNITWIRGEFAGAKSFDDLGIDGFTVQKTGSEILNSFSSYNGISFYAEKSGDGQNAILRLYELENADLAKAFTLDTKYAYIYILNRAGKLVFTNSTDVTPEKVLSRPLVNSFIKMPFRQGQSQVVADGEAMYGFFQEIPDSNLVIFAEKTKQRAMAAVYATIRKVAAASLFYLFVAIVFLQFPLWKATKPIRSLTDMALKLSRGDFDVTVKDEGFGELAVLSRTFVEMADNLKKRDKTIASLHIDKLEKTKMEQGIRVASTIQERFLFKPTGILGSKVQVAAKYEPSLHLAGDWYGVFFDPDRHETIISIVDITGHGIESSMMTPVMSVLFQEQKMRLSENAFDMREFMERCNSALYEYGSGVSTATGIVARFSEDTGVLTWLNAGHPAPVIVGPDGAMIKSKSSGSGTILGFAQKIEMAEQSLSLQAGSVVALFSDGLMTAPVGGAVGFSRKDLFNSLKVAKRQDVKNLLADIMAVWKKKNEGLSVEDDMCLVLGLVK